MSAAVSLTEMTATQQLSTAIVGLEPDSATALRAAFETMFAQADEWASRAKAIVVTSEDDKRGMKFARESRLALKEIRVNAEKARKRLKEDSLRRGKAIDGIANVLKALIEPIESHLLEQETFADRAQAARRDALAAARAESLRAYGTNPDVYTGLGDMDEEQWEHALESAKLAHEARLEAQRQEAEIRREAERIAAERREAERKEAARREAERVERERLQAEENARLKREAEEREAAAKIEREKAAAERARVDAEARAAREAAEAEARKARAAEAALEAERRAAEQQRQAEEQAERDRLAAEEEARQRAALAPDREKLVALAAQVRAIAIPALATERGQAAGEKVSAQLSKMADWITKTASAL